MDDILAELQVVFFAEAEQILDDLEGELMKLEESGFEEERMNKIFRLAHNFKGSSRSVGFQSLADLAHKAEDLLTKLKSRQIEISEAATSALLKAADGLRTGLESLKSDRAAALDYSELMTTLVDLTNSGQAQAAGTSQYQDMLTQGFGFFDDEPAKPTVSAAAAAQGSQSGSSAAKHTPAPKSQSGSKPAPAATKNEDEQLRVPAKKLDHLLTLVGELVVNQTILAQHQSRGDGGKPKATQIVSYLSKIVADVQSVSMSLRMVAVRPLFQKLRRAVRDVATEVQKEIDFVEEGDHVELDKTVVDRMVDPLTHMVRNAVDHGIETTEERAAAGKPPAARVVLSANATDDKVVISLTDDGRGLNKQRILKKAIEKGLVTESAAPTLSADEIHNLIFKPGFSTKEAVTGISGRGVGMEVVQKAVEEMKGTIQIESIEGKGTAFKISLPLSLSIIGGMIIRISDHTYIVPVSQLLETIELSKLRTETSTGKGVMVNLRDEVLPVYSLASSLSIRRSGKDQDSGNENRPALVTSFQGKKISFEVDDILGQQQVVLKRLGKEFDGLPGLLGGAILSSGDPGLVLNLHDLIKRGSIHGAA